MDDYYLVDNFSLPSLPHIQMLNAKKNHISPQKNNDLICKIIRRQMQGAEPTSTGTTKTVVPVARREENILAQD